MDYELIYTLKSYFVEKNLKEREREREREIGF